MMRTAFLDVIKLGAFSLEEFAFLGCANQLGSALSEETVELFLPVNKKLIDPVIWNMLELLSIELVPRRRVKSRLVPTCRRIESLEPLEYLQDLGVPVEMHLVRLIENRESLINLLCASHVASESVALLCTSLSTEYIYW